MSRSVPGADRLRVPVVAAPMFLVSGPELVIAASRAQIVGSFPTPNCRTTDQLDAWMRQINEALAEVPEAAPWAVNMVTHSTNERLEVVARHRPPIVITALGSPRPVIETVHAYGGIVMADVVSLPLARKAAAAGADGLVCVSAGSGGHTGHLSPLAFVAAVREFFEGFVAVGGGVATGAGVAGAVAAGADLVYVGTRFIASAESRAEPDYQQMVLDHGPEDLVVSAALSGAPASWLVPSLVRAGIDPASLAEGGGRFRADGDVRRWKDTWAAGQGLGSIHEVLTTRQIVDRLEEEFVAATRRLAAFETGRAAAAMRRGPV